MCVYVYVCVCVCVCFMFLCLSLSLFFCSLALVLSLVRTHELLSALSSARASSPTLSPHPLLSVSFSLALTRSSFLSLLTFLLLTPTHPPQPPAANNHHTNTRIPAYRLPHPPTAPICSTNSPHPPTDPCSFFNAHTQLTHRLHPPAAPTHRTYSLTYSQICRHVHAPPHEAQTHCNILLHTAIYCNKLQHTPTYCNTLNLPYTTHSLSQARTRPLRATGHTQLARSAVCKPLQHTATHCSTLNLPYTTHSLTHLLTRTLSATGYTQRARSAVCKRAIATHPRPPNPCAVTSGAALD